MHNASNNYVLNWCGHANVHHACTCTLANIQEMPPPYHAYAGQPISTPIDVKKDEAGYPPQVAGYPTGLGPTQNFSQQGYPSHQVAYSPQQGYPLQPYPQVSENLSTEPIKVIHDQVPNSCGH